MKLEGRRVLVTGGGSGIGRAISQLFAEEGATVAVNDINAETAQKTVAEIGSGISVPGDVADENAVVAMFDEIRAKLGGLDVLVNNAGIAETSGMDRDEMEKRVTTFMSEAMSPEGIQTHMDVTVNMPFGEWDRMIRVHLYGTFLCTREALKLMEGGAAIVNMSSIVGLQGQAGIPHYAAAKSGILGFTRSVAQEVGSRKIRVNAICPGYIDTPMTQVIPELVKKIAIARTPLGRLGTPEDIARTALFLASEESSFLTGQWISPNGGMVIQ
ncbi:MAG: SDR family NAD(P)-dependent oxidoreductase [Actinomycetota bacterium]